MSFAPSYHAVKAENCFKGMGVERDSGNTDFPPTLCGSTLNNNNII